jgi:hypothetical protein
MALHIFFLPSPGEHREEKMFQELLKIGIGLRERLLEASSDDEVMPIADLVCVGIRLTNKYIAHSRGFITASRFRKGLMPLVLMIQRD